MEKNVNEKEENGTKFIKGMIFSLYSKLGPEALFFDPIPQDFDSFPNLNSFYIHTPISKRNLLQVAIKSISLLLSDFSFENQSQNNEENLRKIQIFGILPYPDMKMIAYTYFSYVEVNHIQFQSKLNPIQMLPLTFSILIDTKHRGFLFDNIHRFQPIMKQMSQELLQIVRDYQIDSEFSAYEHWNSFQSILQKFAPKFEKIRTQQLTPLTTNRRIKILFTGLKKTGKTSFLFMINRQFSKLPLIQPTLEPEVETLNILGTTIMRWDLPGSNQTNIEDSSKIYFDETDIVYFFIDSQHPRIRETQNFLQKIIQIYQDSIQKIPIIFILTKTDEDVAKKPAIRSVIREISRMIELNIGSHPFKIFETSIFSYYSVISAFSYGLRQLSPNRYILEHILDDFMKSHQIQLGMILNEDGLVLASHERDNIEKYTTSPKQIFEITAAHFASIAKHFSQLSSSDQNSTNEYRISDQDKIILHHFSTQDPEYVFYLLFYTNNMTFELEKNENLAKIIEKIKDLLVIYF